MSETSCTLIKYHEWHSARTCRWSLRSNSPMHLVMRIEKKFVQTLQTLQTIQNSKLGLGMFLTRLWLHSSSRLGLRGELTANALPTRPTPNWHRNEHSLNTYETDCYLVEFHRK
jgi:hypothetical protein